MPRVNKPHGIVRGIRPETVFPPTDRFAYVDKTRIAILRSRDEPGRSGRRAQKPPSFVRSMMT